MKYTVEFELDSDSPDNFHETVYKSLISTFGRIDNLRIVPQRIYFGYIRRDQPLHWHEVVSNRRSTDD